MSQAGGAALPGSDGGGAATAQQGAGDSASPLAEMEKLIDVNKVEGQLHASSIRKVREIVEKHPDEAVTIIRNWLYQEN